MFYRYCHLRFLSPYEYQSEVNFLGGGQLHPRIHLQIHICAVPFEGPLHLWLQSHICLNLHDQLHLWLRLSHYYLLYIYISHIFYFSSAILIALNDNFKPTVLCRLRDVFKDEIDMCSYSLLLANSSFCCELHFLKSFTCMPDICSWGTNYTFSVGTAI